MLVVYLQTMRRESDQPVTWFLAALPLVAILSIGFPILVAGVLCLFAAVRPAGVGPTAPSQPE